VSMCDVGASPGNPEIGPDGPGSADVLAGITGPLSTFIRWVDARTVEALKPAELSQK